MPGVDGIILIDSYFTSTLLKRNYLKIISKNRV